MPEFDPYAVLGVARSATREEIARAYRALAKQLHPDAGPDAQPPASSAMARVNEAWRILSDPSRRAAWHRQHAVVTAPAWTSAPTHVPAADIPRRPAARREEPTGRESGWVTLAVLVTGGVLVAIFMVVINIAAGPPPVEDVAQFASADLSFSHPPGWIVAEGDEGQPTEHRVIAQVLTFGVDPDQLCTSFSHPCALTPASVPPGEASIIITAWQGGSPPVEDPVFRLPSGAQTDAKIGGAPAAFTWESHADGAVAWWQLSPPGFPDRWIEVHASIGGRTLDQEKVLAQINELLASVQFAGT